MSFGGSILGGIGSTLGNLAQAPFQRIEDRITSIPDRFNNTATGQFLNGDFSRITDPLDDFTSIFRQNQQPLPGEATLTGQNTEQQNKDLAEFNKQMQKTIDDITKKTQAASQAAAPDLDVPPAEAPLPEIPEQPQQQVQQIPEQAQERRVTQETFADIVSDQEFRSMSRQEKIKFLQSRGISLEQFREVV